MPLPSSGAGRSLNPPPGSTSAIAFCSRISAGNFTLHLQHRNTLPKCGSVATTSRSSLLPDPVREPPVSRPPRCPHPAWFVLCQRAERSWKVSDPREVFSCRCCTVWVVGAHLPCGNRDSPVGNSQACGTRVFCLEEENKRNSVIHPPCPATGHAAGSTWSATGTWGHLGSTAGGRSAAPTPWHCSRHVSSERRRDT